MPFHSAQLEDHENSYLLAYAERTLHYVSFCIARLFSFQILAYQWGQLKAAALKGFIRREEVLLQSSQDWQPSALWLSQNPEIQCLSWNQIQAKISADINILRGIEGKAAINQSREAKIRAGSGQEARSKPVLWEEPLIEVGFEEMPWNAWWIRGMKAPI